MRRIPHQNGSERIAVNFPPAHAGQKSHGRAAGLKQGHFGIRALQAGSWWLSPIEAPVCGHDVSGINRVEPSIERDRVFRQFPQDILAPVEVDDGPAVQTVVVDEGDGRLGKESRSTAMVKRWRPRGNALPMAAPTPAANSAAASKRRMAGRRLRSASPRQRGASRAAALARWGGVSMRLASPKSGVWRRCWMEMRESTPRTAASHAERGARLKLHATTEPTRTR